MYVTPASIAASSPFLLASITILGLVAYLFTITKRPRIRQNVSPSSEKAPVLDLSIQPLHGFDWRTQEPRRLRPFKKTYHITMAIQSDTPSDLITIDKDYLDRVTLRRSLIAQQGRTVHGCTPAGEAALREVYTYLFQNYLPTRYPSIFSTSPDGRVLYNAATGCALSANPPSPLESLRNIGETVEEDMFILQQTPEGHRSTAFVCCFPAGFNGSEKLDKLLKEIHAPVPGYEKIGASMERFFSKLEVGKSAKRMNWSIQLDDTLFKCQSHDTPEDQIVPMAHIDASKGFARIELQTLTRLPQTRFILFSFKTYLYPLKDIKNEGIGPDLADAIEGLDKGNAPGMWVYKGSKRWARPVCEYLRA